MRSNFLVFSFVWCLISAGFLAALPAKATEGTWDLPIRIPGRYVHLTYQKGPYFGATVEKLCDKFGGYVRYGTCNKGLTSSEGFYFNSFSYEQNTCDGFYEISWNNVSNLYDIRKARCGFCPDGTVLDNTTAECVAPLPDQTKSCDASSGGSGPSLFTSAGAALEISAQCGNPIFFNAGRKVQRESDYSAAGNSLLDFSRSYDSQSSLVGANAGALGERWQHNHDFRLVSVSAQKLYVRRPGGVLIHFAPKAGSSTEWSADADIQDKLEKLANGWQYTTANDVVETYDNNGRLIKRTFLGGRALTYTYDGNGRLQTVADDTNRTLTFAYNPSGQLATLSLPGGGTIGYEYNAGALSAVTYPDASKRQYRYVSRTVGGTTLTTLLSELVDEVNTTFAKWEYTTDGLASSSEHAGGLDRYTVAYTRDAATQRLTTAVVTNPLGAVSSYTLSSVLGVNRPTVVNRQFDSKSRSQTFDANGNLVDVKDWDGIASQYSYDLTRNLPTGVTVALGTPQVRTVTTTWHPTFRLPVTITEPGRVTTFTYDNTKGLLTQKQVTADGVSRSESWSYFPNGLLQTATDARGKVTNYTYDAQGNLATVTDPVGLVTQFTSYDPHGNVLTQIAPNGVTTTFTYDLRQRLKTRTTGGELTQFAYKPTGLLEKVAFPDQSWLQYRYDPAHRLIGIDHSNGSRVDYTLDNAGNTKREDRYDPAGVLAAAQQAATQAQSVTTAPKAQ
ncbi:DUF6531 domain-containing protein [Chitinolyticbacter meiyuanensis]|uniref:DUF6531 domain-containing protein n=1 Tax=Chitinolyticbacter meiyuanensis TaxID=682798 RepID=UPI0011E5F527|nr:DUF6531 domain-containing protein [Chitinolyticbacter meiyuanensis]